MVAVVPVVTPAQILSPPLVDFGRTAAIAIGRILTIGSPAGLAMAKRRSKTRRMIATNPRHAGGRPRTVDRCPLGLTIERLAVRRGIHLDELARSAGISTPSLYRIMTGTIRSPRLATVKAIASALDVGVEKLA